MKLDFLKKATAWGVAMGILKFIFGICLPLVAFVGSGVLTPEWRGAGEGAAHNYWEMLVAAKVIIWAPVVVWTLVSFFSTQILPRKKYYRWEAWGLWLGVLISIVSVAFVFFSPRTIEFYVSFPKEIWETYSHEGFLYVLFHIKFLLVFLPSPLYIGYWYFHAARKVSRAFENNPQKDFLASAIVFTPFVAGAFVYAQKLFNDLPTTAPDCYIVSAAGHANPRLVRMIPFHGTNVHEQVVLYKAVDLWLEAKHPRWHRSQRSVYDKLGPLIAHWIKAKQWRANLAYILLLPGHLLCRLILKYAVK